MPEWVGCAECNTRYDAEGLAFCPHCGSTARGATRASPAQPGRSPRRMRVQLGGVLLLLVGALYLTVAVTALLNPGPVEGQVYQWGALQEGGSVEGGEVELAVVEGGTPVAGAQVLVRAGNQTVEGETDASGHFNATLAGAVAGRINVTYQGSTWTRSVLATSGQTVQIDLDLAQDPAASDRVAGASGLARSVVFAFLALSLLLASGGLAAVLTKWRGLALAGPLPVVLLGVLLVALIPSGASVATLAMVGLPYALVLSGRSAFRRG